MSKLCVVPQDPTKNMIYAAAEERDRRVLADQPWTNESTYIAMLAACPPIPDDIEAALTLAKEYCADPEKRSQAKLGLCLVGLPLIADMIDEAVTVSRALLKACGREE